MIFTKRTNQRITCCFIGPSFEKAPIKNRKDKRYSELLDLVQKQVLNMIATYRVRHFICGVGRGFDQFVAQTLLALKRDYPFCTLECVIPYETISTWWTESQRDQYFTVVEKCDQETMIQSHYSSDCYEVSNQYMIRQSDYLLTVWDGRSGRTARTVSMARKRKVRVIQIDPDTLEVTPNIHIVG